MGWVKLDDQFFMNAKARKVGKSGRELAIASWCWCSTNLNDGIFVKEDIPFIAAMAGVSQDIAQRLYDAGMWIDHGDTVEVSGYLKYNPSRASVQDRKAQAKAAADARYAKGNAPSKADSNAVSIPLSSSSPTDGFQSLSRPTDPEGDGSAADDEDCGIPIPEGTWDAYAEQKLKHVHGVKQPAAWKRKVARNAQTEMGPQARRFLASFELDAPTLARALLSSEYGEPTAWLQYEKRRETADA